MLKVTSCSVPRCGIRTLRSAFVALRDLIMFWSLEEWSPSNVYHACFCRKYHVFNYVNDVRVATSQECTRWNLRKKCSCTGRIFRRPGASRRMERHWSVNRLCVLRSSIAFGLLIGERGTDCRRWPRQALFVCKRNTTLSTFLFSVCLRGWFGGRCFRH